MRITRSALGPPLLCLLLAAACVGEDPSNPSSGPSAPASVTSAAPFPVSLTDDDGVEVKIDAKPERIVTFAPSMTEIVFALGLGDRLVGVSGPFDDFPAQAQDIEQVGGAGEFGVDPNLENVVALEPDLFLTIAGGDTWKEQLRKLGITVVTLNATDLDDLFADIRAIGTVAGAAEEADDLATEMQAQAEAVEALAVERVTCFFEAYYPPLTAVGPNTFIYDLLERAGCDPVTVGATSDYPAWSVDDLVADGPAVYLATFESAESLAQIAERPGFDGITAVANGDVALLDSDLVTRPGPRVAQGLQQISAALLASGD